MEPATEKQINFARKLGIDNPEQFSKMALKELIDKALNKEKVKPQSPQTPAIAQIVVTRTEMPHSFEFGKAGKRHKIYYGEISDLLAQIEKLRIAGLIDDENIMKPEEFFGDIMP